MQMDVRGYLIWDLTIMRPRDHPGDPGEHDESGEVHMYTLGHVVHQGEYIHSRTLVGHTGIQRPMGLRTGYLCIYGMLVVSGDPGQPTDDIKTLGVSKSPHTTPETSGILRSMEC